MFRFAWTYLIVTLVAAAPSLVASAGYFSIPSNGWFVSRDKKGTSGGQEKEHGSQIADSSALTSRFSFAAEGTGVEPATPYGAPHLQDDAHPRKTRGKAGFVSFMPANRQQ